MTKVIGKSKYLTLVERNNWEFVTRHTGTGVVGIVAITPNKEIVLVEQYREPLQGNVIEIPAGLLGDEDGAENEIALEAARRELLEETGYESDEVYLFGKPCSATAGLTDEVIQIVIAKNAVKTGEGGGIGDENITVHVVPLNDLVKWLAGQQEQKKTIDPKIFIALAIQ